MTYKYTLATKLITHYEGFHSKPYTCPAGILTVGYGRTTGSMRPTTKEREMAWLETELRRTNLFINKVVIPRQSPEEMAALMSFIYNVGTGAFSRSTFLKTINSGNSRPDELLKWSLANGEVLPGLAKRRMAEYLLYKNHKFTLF